MHFARLRAKIFLEFLQLVKQIAKFSQSLSFSDSRQYFEFIFAIGHWGTEKSILKQTKLGRNSEVDKCQRRGRKCEEMTCKVFDMSSLRE